MNLILIYIYIYIYIYILNCFYSISSDFYN